MGEVAINAVIAGFWCAIGVGAAAFCLFVAMLVIMLFVSVVQAIFGAFTKKD